MTSSKLLLVLMAAASSLAAPQINERQVVDNVITQLQPAILQALSQANLGSSSFSSRSSSSVPITSVSSGSRFSGASSGSRFGGASSGSQFAGASGSRFSGSTGATRGSFSSSPSSSASISSLTSSVVSSLSPSIEAAVAQALAGSRRSGSSFRGGSSVGATRGATAEPDYGPAQYDYSYKVADDDKQSYIAKQETRNGDDVTGTYNYVDATGSLVTVNYEAGPEGYSETRDVQKGAVQIREMPGPWTGPLAGVDDGEASVSSASSKNNNRGLSQSDLIAQIIGALQPQISSAVQSAISSSSVSSASRTSNLGQNSFASTRRAGSSFGSNQNQNRFASTGRAGSNFGSGASSLGQNSFASTRNAGSSFGSNQGNIVNSVISSLGPRISSAVNSAISSSRTVSVPRARASIPARQAASSGSIGGLFGVSGENSVKIATPEFQIQY